MVGPSLKQLHAHHAIHQGARSGAIQKMDFLLQLLNEGNVEDANHAADQLIEYWETRVISHADAEESGFYQEKVEQNPDLKEAVIQLTRDHDLLRMIVKDIHECRKEHGLNEEVIQKFHSLITINEIHSREEERLLF